MWIWGITNIQTLASQPLGVGFGWRGGQRAGSTAQSLGEDGVETSENKWGWSRDFGREKSGSCLVDSGLKWMAAFFQTKDGGGILSFSFMKFWSTVCRTSAKGAGGMQNRDSDLSCIKPSSGVKTDAGWRRILFESTFPQEGFWGFPEISSPSYGTLCPFQNKREGKTLRFPEPRAGTVCWEEVERGSGSLTAKVFKEMYSLWGKHTHAQI